MADTKRSPYVWATWITKLLAGEEACWWRAWYKAHYKYEKVKLDTLAAQEHEEFLREWTKKHDAIVQRRAAELRDQGHVVRVEDDASFKIRGKTGAMLAGKPDLVAMKGNGAIVIDAKAGRHRSSDHWQVLTYIFALPMSWLSDVKLFGEIAYFDCDETVRPFQNKERDEIVKAIKKVSGNDPPPRMPRIHECVRCDIASCGVRLQAPTGDASRYF